MYFKWNRKYLCQTSNSRSKTVGIVYEPPDQTMFLEILSNSLNLLNRNLYHNGSALGEKNKNIIKGVNKVSSETEKCL